MKVRALQMLQSFRKDVPDLPPALRMRDVRCRAYADASVLCLEGRYSDAVAVLDNATKS